MKECSTTGLKARTHLANLPLADKFNRDSRSIANFTSDSTKIDV